MKVKLLKKIRKRFKIYYYPKGYKIFKEVLEGQYYELIDDNNRFFDTICELTDNLKSKNAQYNAKTEKECENILLDHMLKRIRQEYRHLSIKDKQYNKSIKQIWWK